MGETEKCIYENASGALTIPLMNDRFFIFLLQECPTALESIVCGVLRMNREDIKSIVIKNPIKVGTKIDDKEMILDLLIELNDETLIDLEMQVENEGNWPERSLSYIYRADDTVRKGGDYKDLKTIISVGFLNYTLDKNNPEFLSKYMITNSNNNDIFTDKLQIYVIDLNHIELATDEDVKYGLTKWANFFKSTTWEELKSLAKEDAIMAESTTQVFKFTTDDYYTQLREEMAISDRVHRENRRKELEEECRQLETSKSKLEATNSKLEATNSELEATNSELEATNSELEATNSELEARHLADLAEIERLKKLLAEKE